MATLMVKKEGVEVNGGRELRPLVFLSPELLCAVIKQLLIHLHEKLQSVVDEAVDGPAHKTRTSQHWPPHIILNILTQDTFNMWYSREWPSNIDLRIN